MHIEYVLFVIGIFVLGFSLFLSYRLEKNQNSGNDNKSTIKEINELKELYKKQSEKDKSKDELDELYELIKGRINTSNDYVKLNREELEEIRETKNDLLGFEDDISRSITGLNKKLDDIKDENEGIKRDIEDSLSRYKKINNYLIEEIHNLFNEINEIKIDISELKNKIITIKKKDDKQNNKNDFLNDVNISKDSHNENVKNIKLVKRKESKNINKLQKVKMKFADENQKEKYELYEKIKAMKEQGRDITEIANRVNMGIREVELFWKFNSSGVK